MTFSVNKSPMAGKDPKSSKLTSRVIRDRLYKELDRNVALRVEDDPDSADTYIVSGRGQLHLTVLIETMRREGFELMIGSPMVIIKKDPDSGAKLEPFEEVEATVPEEYVGAVVDLLAKRKVMHTYINSWFSVLNEVVVVVVVKPNQIIMMMVDFHPLSRFFFPAVLFRRSKSPLRHFTNTTNKPLERPTTLTHLPTRMLL